MVSLKDMMQNYSCSLFTVNSEVYCFLCKQDIFQENVSNRNRLTVFFPEIKRSYVKTIRISTHIFIDKLDILLNRDI